MRVTKSPIRSSTTALVGYLLAEPQLQEPKVGFIVPRSIGGSVVRHRVTRQLRHAARSSITQLPKDSLVVVRAIKHEADAGAQIPSLFASLTRKATR